MAKRNSMRDGPLAQLFKATEAGQSADKTDEEEPARGRAKPKSSPGTSRPQLIDLPDPDDSSTRNFPRPEGQPYLAVIRVVGVGGGGCNAINRMIESDVKGVEFIAVNTDIQQLQMSDAPTKIHIGRDQTQGLGSGADPEVGRLAAESSYDRIKTVLRGSDMVFVTAGEGGGTGTGAAPVIARIAREVGALTVGIVTSPFGFEGSRRGMQARGGVEGLRESSDTVIVIPNDRLLQVLEKGTSLVDAFRIADDVLRQGVQGICDLITLPGLINLDFADVKTVMANAGTAMMGIGMSTGPNRAAEAATRAVHSPLIDHEVRNARGILLSISGGSDLSLHEVNEAAEIVRAAADERTNIIFGASVDEQLAGQMWVTVVATGFSMSGSPPSGGSRGERPHAPAPDDLLEPPGFLQG
jgi:cell division protein FtsZ